MSWYLNFIIYLFHQVESQRSEEELRKREEVIRVAELKLRLLEEEQLRQKEKQRMEQHRIEEEKERLVHRENERLVCVFSNR